MLVSVVLTIVCHVIFVVYLFLIDCCCHCCLFQLRFARRQFEVQPVRDVLPPFLSLIVCDLISDGGGYLQFAGGSKEVPGSQDASLQLRESLPKVVTSGARPLHRGFYRNCQGKQIVLHDMA